MRGNRFVQIRRDRLLFDGFDNLNVLGERLRGRVRITFIDAYGAPEAGVVRRDWDRGEGCGILTAGQVRLRLARRLFDNQ